MRKTFIAIIAIIVFASCGGPVKEANKIFEEQADSIIENDIKYVIETMSYLRYAKTANYWYGEELTAEDIINDNYKKGYKGLTQLQEDIDLIPSDNGLVEQSVISLNKEIKKAKKEIKKKQAVIENANGFMGMMMYGGTYGALGLINMFSSEAEKEKMQSTVKAFPPKVKEEFDFLRLALIGKLGICATKMNYLENKAFDLTEANTEQKTEIRTNLKLFIRNKFLQNNNSSDTTLLNETVEDIFDYYDRKYKLTNTTK